VNSNPTKEKAILFLLGPVAIDYIRAIRAVIEKDPEYVEKNREDVGNIVHGFLSGAGFFWTQEIFDSEWPDILQQAIARLSLKEP
jgi:hypothetical protein